MRFDRDGFERSPLDRPGNVTVYAVYLAGAGDLQASGIGTLRETIHLSGAGEMQTDGTGNLTRTILLVGIGDGQTSADGDLFVYAVISFTYSGTLAVGKILLVNAEDFTVLNDGVNAIAAFTGDFPHIYPGENEVVYTDTGGSRTMKITVTKQDRSV